jgi:hypothetical protein
MELTNQFVTTETNKTAEIIVKILENLLGRGHTVWMDNFYNSSNLARDSVVGTATSYMLDDRGVGIQVPVGPRIFSSPDRPDRL